MPIHPDLTHFWLDRIHRGDCAQVMTEMPENSVDMVFADPPYNLRLGSAPGMLKRPDDSTVDGVHASWDNLGDHRDYDCFSERWLRVARRILKPDGTLWVIGSYHNVYRLGAMLQDLGFWVLNDIAWIKSNPMPNFRGSRFTNAHETLIWCSVDEKARYRFNYQALKAFNDNVQMRSTWMIPICSGSERLKDNQGRKAHPTQKPEALLYRVLLAASKPGDVVLDPFLGTGTTAVMCRKMARRWVGIERDNSYADLAETRITSTQTTTDPEAFKIESRRDAPRIPIGTLLEHGLLQPGEALFDAGRRWQAKLRADGHVITDQSHGSIHRMGAALQKSSTCNGWTFWHVERPGGAIPLDHLRQRFLAHTGYRAEVVTRVSTSDVRKSHLSSS